MIEIFRKGFRLDIPRDQIVTFKKSQNLNGVQDRYAYSNTLSLVKTANNKKLLDLTDLPMGKAQTMQNGYEVDIVLNGSIQLKNQVLKITKETLEKVELYILYSDSNLVSKLKETYVNSTVAEIKYKKTRDDFGLRAFFNYDPITPSVWVQTQSAAGVYVAEEMPLLINLQWLITKIFQDIGYALYGDFTLTTNTIDEYYIAPNQGVYQIYSGTGPGFSPTFDAELSAFDLLNYTLAYFNCYATVDDTYKTVVINQWSNITGYKRNFADYSRFFTNYQDFAFQSKLAKKNVMAYGGGDSTFNYSFSNPLSSEESSTYLSSKFGSGSTQTFDDAEPDEETGFIPVRANGELGESSAVRIYKVSPGILSYYTLYENGQPGPGPIAARKAISVSMGEVYRTFHKTYTDFILTPLIQNIIFRYDAIFAADFSMTKIFYLEQLASYWIPLEINFSTTKDKIIVKAMLVKQRRVPAPILNNFNSVLLDFRQRVIFPIEYLLSMYPMPPNEYPWAEVTFLSYDPTKNTLLINGVVVPAEALPQTYTVEPSLLIEFEADMPGDVVPNKFTDSLYIKAIDSNGGISNDAYITLKHTGVASLESNFRQLEDYVWERNNFSNEAFSLNVLKYVVGLKPNINNTITSVDVSKKPVSDNNISGDTTFDLIDAYQLYPNMKVKTLPFVIKMTTKNNGIGSNNSTTAIRVYINVGGQINLLTECNTYTEASAGEQVATFNINAYTRSFTNVPADAKARVYLWVSVRSNGGSTNAKMEVFDMGADISTIVNT